MNIIHNQLLLFLNNFFSEVFFMLLTYSFFVVHYMLVPFEMAQELFQYAVHQFYVITSLVFGDVLKLCNLARLNFELLVNVVESQKQNLVQVSGAGSKSYMKKNTAIYQRIKLILNHFHILPLSPREGITGLLILKKIPDFFWRNIIPYPRFFFEDTFSDACIGDGKIIVTLPTTVPVPTIIVKDEDTIPESVSPVTGKPSTPSSPASTDVRKTSARGANKDSSNNKECNETQTR